MSQRRPRRLVAATASAWSGNGGRSAGTQRRGRVSGSRVAPGRPRGLHADRPRQGLQPSPGRGGCRRRPPSVGCRIPQPADGNRAAPAARVGRSQRPSATGSGAQRPGPPGHSPLYRSPGPTCAAGAASYRCGSISGKETEFSARRWLPAPVRGGENGSRDRRNTGISYARNTPRSHKCGLRIPITTAGIVRWTPRPFLSARGESRERCGRGRRPPRAPAKAQVTGFWRFCGVAAVFLRRPGGVSAARVRPMRQTRHCADAARTLTGDSAAARRPRSGH